VPTNDAERVVVSVIEYLSHCGEPDIEAGIGALLGLSPEKELAAFRDGLHAAISSALTSPAASNHTTSSP
jgi:hypothetical protein